jgi:hypothetical protein
MVLGFASVLWAWLFTIIISVSEKTSSETVWKIEVGFILEPWERADRDIQALLGRLLSPETAFNEPSDYFPDSL